jgi:hypothetical protein
MAEIYQNSTITIAATASSNPSEGLFRRADPAHVSRHMPSDNRVHIRTPLEHDPSLLPLFRRGWIFQERLLSPRVLHFTEHELIWECMQDYTCECGQFGLRLSWPSSKIRWDPLSNQAQEKRGLPESLHMWHNTVSQYSKLQLSKPSDIFPSISGVAKVLRDVTGWEYVAGMWKEFLIHDMSWRVLEPGRSRRCVDWRAPTFSWASVIAKGTNGLSGGLIKYSPFLDHFVPTIHPTIIETNCTTTSHDTTGQLDSAYLILSGTLIETSFYCTPTMGRIAPVGQTVETSTRLHPDFDVTHESCGVKDGDTLFCLKMIVRSLRPFAVETSYSYLVLKKLDERPWGSQGLRGDCEFERVGLLEDRASRKGVQLEVASEEHAVQHDAIVKII